MDGYPSGSRLGSGDRLEAVNRICAALYAKTDIDDLLTETLEISRSTTDSEAGSILLLDPEMDCLVFRQVLGPASECLLGKTVPLASSGQCATVFRTGQSEVRQEGFDPNYDLMSSFRTRATLTTPIRMADKKSVGVIQLLNKRSGPFDERDLELLGIVSTLTATILENARRNDIEKQAALAQSEWQRQRSLTRILGFIGHQLKNQALILDGTRSTFLPLLSDELGLIEQSGIVNVSTAKGHCKELDMMLRSATDKVIRQAKVINEYGERSELFAFRSGNLREILEEELQQLAQIARRYGSNVDLTGMQRVPEFPFEGFFLGQAVFNLVNNAFQAMREHKKGDTITVRVAHMESGNFPSGNFVEIEVADNGPGMPAHILESILQGRAVTTRRNGSGVGTRLVHDVALTHGGQLCGESTIGAGTVFRLRLPFQPQKTNRLLDLSVALCDSSRISYP